MKICLFLILFMPLALLGQGTERLNDLRSNQTLIKNSLRNINNSFYYIEDTLDLPIRDDFSTNKFVPYDAEIGQSNVMDLQQFSLWNLANTSPLGLGSFALDTTFVFEYDTLSTGDSIVIINKTAFASQQITQYDICNYPFISSTISVWPPYNVLDSSAMIAADVNDTLSVIDLSQDSTIIHLVMPTPRDTGFIWVDNFACRNSRYAINPPSVGVATFDGLNENGFPYDFNSNVSEVADYLTSKPIKLGASLGIPTYLSFYVQSTGLGNSPEEEDSLILEYWVPSTEEWEYVWSTNSLINAVQDSFYYTHLEIDSTKYFEDGFRFRFKNFASVSGNLDHWHVDYIYLNNRAAIDTVFADVAIVYETFGLLNDYTAMPWKHYKWNPNFYTKDTSEVTVYNNNTSIESLFPGANMYVKYNGMRIDSVAYVTGTSPNILSRVQRQAIYPEIGFELDTNVNDTCGVFQICHTIETDDAPFFRFNDTVRYEQVLSNYYAYDDGSAEAAYGPFGAGAMVAQSFTLEEPDSIRGVMIHFAPTVEDVSQKLFRLTIWDDDGSGKPGTILYQTEPLFGESPVYTNVKNGFYEYFLKDNLGNPSLRLEVDGTYHVGWVQTDPDVLNVGFDRNIDNGDKINFKVSANWQNTSFEGSLMIRPVFVSDKDGFLSDENLLETFDVSIYPNPTTGVLNISAENLSQIQMEILNLSGKVVLNYMTTPNTVDISGLPSGIYLVRLIDENGQSNLKKILKQ